MPPLRGLPGIMTARGGAAAPVVTPNFIENISLGGPLNNFDGCIGFGWLTGVSSTITITHLSRWKIAGNSEMHTLYLITLDPDFGIVDSVVVDMSTGSAGNWVTGELSSPVNLIGNKLYGIVSSEVNGGDQWSDDSTFDTTFDVTASGSGYDTNDPPTAFTLFTVGEVTFGPVNAVATP